MNSLMRFYQSTLSIFRSMTPASRVSSAIMIVAILASMIYLFQYQMGGAQTYLFGGQEFSQSEIGLMETALAKAGLNQYEVVGNRVRVPMSARDKYTKAVADGDAVPKTILRTEDDAVTSNPFISSTAQKEFQKRQKTQQIEDAIRQFPKVEHAQVVWDSQMEGAPYRRLRTTCAVVVKPQGSMHLSGDDVLAIQRLISKSLTGIKDSDITIVDSNSGESYAGDSLSASAAESEFLRTKRRYEEDYRKKIALQLVAYPGATIGVEVELDPTLGTNTYQRTLDTPTTLQQQTERETTRSQTGGNGGPPGTRSNLNATANATASLAESRQTSSDVTKESSSAIAGGAIQHIQQAGLTIKSAKVSVGIPQNTVEKLFLIANPPADAAEATIDPTKLQEYFETMIRKPISEKVRALIKPGTESGQDPFEDIVVHMDPSLEFAPLPTTPFSETALTWLAANWQNLGLFGFGLVSLVMLRSAIKTAGNSDEAMLRADAELNQILPPQDESDEIEEIVVEKDGSTRIVKRKKTIETDEERAARENQLRKRFQNRQPTLREELAELVEQDLDAAATVLRAWIGESTN
jgi:flagellar biosynthesis/type III secretory pathway M-ring protein FliF/YscJ